MHAFRFVTLVSLACASANLLPGCSAEGSSMEGGGGTGAYGGIPLATGGTPAAMGGTPGYGGTPAATGGIPAAPATGGAPSIPPTGSQVVNGGFITAGPWQGYGFTATDPGYATITPACGNGGCVPAFVGNSFCMQGTVNGRPGYDGFAMLGWNVNQGIDGSAPQTWTVPATGGVTVTVTNAGNTPLRVQLQGTDPHSAADRWCADLVSGQMVAWTAFKTNCWTGGNPQTPLTAGTPIQQAAIMVPGTQTDLPFDVCLVDIQIQ
jgi:hypothetical protein